MSSTTHAARVDRQFDAPLVAEPKESELDEDADRSAPQLPTDFPRAPAARYLAASHAFTFSTSTLDRVQPLSERSLEALAALLAAFGTLLHRYTQQEALTLSVVRWDYRGDGPRSSVMSFSSDPTRSAQRLLSETSQWLADPAQAPRPGWELPTAAPVLITLVENVGVDVDAQSLGERAATLSPNPDLHLVFALGQAGFRGSATYNAYLFQVGTIERLVGHLQVVFAALLRQPEALVDSLALLTPQETEQLLVEWRSASTGYAPFPLHRYVERHALEQPDALAVTFKDQSLSYAELNRRANRLSYYLLENGVGPGSRVAVCVEPSFDIVICILAIFKAGATHVPLEPTYPTERLSVILEDTQPEVVLTQSRPLKNLPEMTARALCLDQSEQQLAGLSERDPGVEVSLAQTAFIIYTSGTTGKPKGVMLSHANLVHYVLGAQKRYDFKSEDVFPAFARFTFSITMFEVMSPLVVGGRLIILERDHVLDFKRLVPTLQQATVVHASPSLLRKLLGFIRDNKIAPASFGNLRHVSSGGDMVSADLMEGLKQTFPSAELFVIYGCSEIACMGCTYPIPRAETVSRSRVGKPFDNVSVRLYDAYQNLVPIGVPGEIYFGGAGVAHGYLNREELTREKFVSIDGERFYRTGDVGRFDADGNIEILGRSDFQIKLRGIRIELGEIESTLRLARGVREAVVTARQLNKNQDQSLVAYLVLDPALARDLKEIRRFVQAKLPDYMVPAVFVMLDAMPVNINLKIDRRALPMPRPEDLAQMRTHAPPRNERERQLVGIWESVLETSPIGIHDSFFDVGGDSLLALTLMVQIEKALGKTLPLSALLTEPTIEQLAGLLGERTQARNAIVPLRSGGGRPPIFFVHDGDGEILPYRNLALRLNPEYPIYGIQPHSQGGYPMLHTRLSDVVDYYTSEIRKVAPHGPYLLGGLCIGGFIAFEIARKLEAEGESVPLVALIDAAHVKAQTRSLASTRLNRFTAAMKADGPRTEHRKALVSALKRAGRKLSNLLFYEARSRAKKSENAVKMRLFRYYLDTGQKLPRFLEHISVSTVLRFAEKEYVMPERYSGEVVLLRATRKDSAFDGTLVDDTPYVDLFDEPLLGWEGRTASLLVHDLPGGHSSMLQEPNVAELTEKLQAYLDARFGSQRTSPVKVVR